MQKSENSSLHVRHLAKLDANSFLVILLSSVCQIKFKLLVSINTLCKNYIIKTQFILHRNL